MTIVCFKAGIMAADTALWAGDVVRGHTRKIARTSWGALVAAAGEWSDCFRFRTWAGEGFEDEGFDIDVEEGAFGGIIVAPAGSVHLVDCKGNVMKDCKADFYAEGCSVEMAMGCMMAGASAEEAVRHCIENHAYAGGSVQVERLDGATPLMPAAVADIFLRNANLTGMPIQ